MRGVAIASLLVSCACRAGLPSPDVAIGQLLREQSAAWNRGDLDAFCSVYASDATFITPTGSTRGRQAVLDRYRKKYVDKEGMGSLSLVNEEVRSLPSSGASVIARWTLTWPDKTATGHTLLVLRSRGGGQWEIVQDASM
jgi:uncharacterized protein (TIGR02246 family)